RKSQQGAGRRRAKKILELPAGGDLGVNSKTGVQIMLSGKRNMIEAIIFRNTTNKMYAIEPGRGSAGGRPLGLLSKPAFVITVALLELLPC
ncbi:MAG: hypothetical protein FWG46_08390, partial [Treponema sp.]|nr:hypothetical protein [Treponema sp.]